MKVTKAERKILEELIAKLVLSGRVEITSPVEHRSAEMLVKMGAAVVTKKKNYGRISEIIDPTYYDEMAV